MDLALGVGIAIAAVIGSISLALAVIAWARARATDKRVDTLEARADRASAEIHVPLGHLARTLTDFPPPDSDPMIRGPPTKRCP